MMPEGRKKRGRPKLTLTLGIAQTMRERVLEDGLWKDRDRWKLAMSSYNGYRKIPDILKSDNK